MAECWASSTALVSAAKVAVGLGSGLAADQGPGGVDHLLLQLGELLGLLAVAALLGPLLRRARGRGLALAEDLLEVADLGEYMSPDDRRGLPSGPTSSAQKK